MKGREVFDRIPEEVCRELETIVGSENITTDPNICMSNYGFGFGHEVYYLHGVTQAPGAIVMPQTTEEVAQIVRVCNRYGIPFHPYSSHCTSPSDPALVQNAVSLDLKRMTEWEIDQKNMYAIVESGVISAQMAAEANKRDLYYIVSGGGGLTGVLSNHLSCGWGHFNYRATPFSNRRINGLEWVSPEGEIYRMGSLANGDDDWYWGDGFGPDLIGFLKGLSGWWGGMGITTKMSVRLYPFQPDQFTPQGIGGRTTVALPPRVKYYNVTFPTKNALLKAIDEIGKTDIAHIVNIVPAFWRSMAKCAGIHDFRNEFFDGWDNVTEEEVANTHIGRFLLVGRTSLEQLEYEERVLMDIVAECDGTARKTPQRDEATFRYANTADMWMMTGCFGATEAGMESARCTKLQNEVFTDILYNYEHKHDFLDQKGEFPWYLMWDRGRQRYTENHVQPDARDMDPADPGGDKELMGRTLPWIVSTGPVMNLKTGCRGLFEGTVSPITGQGMAYHHYDEWLHRFKTEFDPKGLSGDFWPFANEKIVEGAPGVLTEEYREAMANAEKGPWLGNPE